MKPQNWHLDEKFKSVKRFIVNSSWKKRIIIVLIILGIAFLSRYILGKSKEERVTYNTSTAQKGTLISSISGSGTITSGNYTNVTTKVSGAVKNVFVTNGGIVQKGQKIAEVTQDDYAKERQTAAWVAYLEAKEAALEAINTKASSDITMWQARQDILDAQEAFDDMNENDTNPATNEVYTEGERMIITKTLDQKRKAFSVAESKYLNADADVSNANAKIAAAHRNYQENSATIVAPATGVITDLALAEGIIVSASSTTSTTSGATIVSAQTVGKINDPNGQLIATVNLTEIDIINVKANQIVTLTLDAYEDKTFTGNVLAVNTSGSANSGVTSYPVTILLDPVTVEIYPNMAVSVEIITNIKTDVLLIPSTAIQTLNDQSSVQIMKDGEVRTVQVETGSSNDSQTEIVSGLNEGDEVIISTITSGSTSQNNSTSPFSGMGRTGGTIRIPGNGGF